MKKIKAPDRPQPDALAMVLALDREAATPLYLQVRNGLARLIRSGRIGHADALPSERALAEQLGISRVTTRKAINALASDGLIQRRQGSGNFVAPLLEQPLTRLTSFTEELRQRGYVPSSRWIKRSLGVAQPEEMVAFGLSPGMRLARLERVRMADQTPMALETNALPISVLPDPEAVRDSLYQLLADRQKLPSRALQHIRAVNASAQQASLLAVAEGHALLFIKRAAYAEDGRCVEITHTWCLSDYYDFVAELRR
jgi:GntR family transcriptional regulator